jgi:HAD superfamily hydrolase (TIGR01509 family)
MAFGKNHGTKGILFDFDGTLTYPGALNFPAIKRELNCPSQMPILEYLDTQPETRRDELLTILALREEQAAQGSMPNEGAERCLQVLKDRGLALGILTRNTMKAVSLALENFNGVRVEDFTVIITRENALPKPNPDGIYQAAKGMGIAPSELMVVGDFRFDVLAGKAAGALTVFLTNNGKGTMAPGDPEPDHTVESLGEIIDLVCEGNGPGRHEGYDDIHCLHNQ